MKIGATVHPKSRAGWRSWLKKNHKAKTEIWLVYDKGAGRNLTWVEAVQEALCFGWIDGVAKSIDEKQYAQRFSPRKNAANWSPVNRKHFAELEAAGLMTSAGRAVGPEHAPPAAKRWKNGDPLPSIIQRGLKGAVRKAFDDLPRSYREQYVRFVIEAKQEATQRSRLAKIVEKLARNERPS